MFMSQKPTDDQVRRHLATLEGALYSYPSVRCTETGERPDGYCVDQLRVPLGHGPKTFERAAAAIRQWKMFPHEVADIAPPHEPLKVGTTVAVLYWAAPIFSWAVMPARIVYVVDDEQRLDGASIRKFGFAYGTLNGHWERGEELFSVEWNRRDDSVWYHLLAISRPRHWLAWLGYPYARYEQARFRKWSGVAMQRAVREDV